MEPKQLYFQNERIKGTLEVPGDKSISHRAVMFGAIADGTTTINHFLAGEDCLSTIECFKQMGVRIEKDGSTYVIEGSGWSGLQPPTGILNVGNSGTTIRLLLGLLAGRPFKSILIGDESIGKRPMSRVVVPLRQMGAVVHGKEEGKYTPLEIQGGSLHGFEYTLPVASAQVKSALMLAGLQASGETIIHEPEKTRDHTERMIKKFGGLVTERPGMVVVNGGQSFTGQTIDVPGDISSAAFWLVAAAIVPDSELTITNVGLNPTRTGIIDVMKKMGADIQIEMDRSSIDFEPRGTVTVRSAPLKGITIEGDLIPKLIDEIPAIALLASQANGETIIRDAAELKVKETNRIDAVATQLGNLGVVIEPTEDGLIIKGNSTVEGGIADSLGDHRIGMTIAIASLLSQKPVYLKNHEAIAVSYPTFFEDLQQISSSR